MFDPNPVNIQRQHAPDAGSGVGGPRGSLAAIAAGRALGELEQLGRAAHQAEAGKLAKLLPGAGNASLRSRLASAFQHDPSNMPLARRWKGRKSAIPAAPGQLLQILALDDQVSWPIGRDRGPKLFASAGRFGLLEGISTLYFIRAAARGSRRAAPRRGPFPRSQPSDPLETAEETPNLLKKKENVSAFPCSQRKREKPTCTRVRPYHARAPMLGTVGTVA